jgi:hypothetical protein
MITVESFEKQVEDIEGITIVIRAPSGTQVESYDYDRKAADSSSIGDWLKNRITPKIGELEVKILEGDLESPRRNSKKLETVRQSYK